MKFQYVIEVEVKDESTFNLERRLAVARALQDEFEDDYLQEDDKVNVEIRGPYDPAAEKHPLRLTIHEATDGSDTIAAIVQTPNHQGPRGSRTFITWPCKSDLIKEYGSVEAFFNHVDGYLVDENGKVNEDEFIDAQRMGSDYTGWFEIPNVPE